MDESGLVGRLKNLSELHASGALTDDEFTAAKASVLGASRAGGSLRHRGRTPIPVESQLRPRLRGRPHRDERGSSLARPRGEASTSPAARRAAERVAAPSAKAPWAGHGGAITSGTGGLLTLLAFLTMPLATVPFLGSITGANAAGFASQFGALGLLWLVPLLAAAVVGLASWQIFGVPDAQRRTVSITVMVLTGLVVLDFLVVLGAIQAETSRLGVSVPSFTGAGLWFALIAMVAAGFGAGVELSSSRPASDVSGFLSWRRWWH